MARLIDLIAQWRHYFMGLLVCLIYVVLPFSISYLNTPADSEWVPVNDQIRSCGDDKFYAATVQEIRETPFDFRSPVSPTIGTYGVEVFKAASKWLTAMLTFFIPDMRIAYPVSFTASVVLSYTLCYLASNFAGLGGLASAIVSLLTLFYYKGLQNQGLLPLWNSSGTAFFEMVNDNFRYVVMQSSICFAWLTHILCLHYPRGSYLSRVFLWTLVLIALPYSYYSVTISSGLILTFFGIYTFFKEPSSRKYLLVTTALSCLVLSSIGFSKHLSYFLNANSQPVIQAHTQFSMHLSTSERIIEFIRLCCIYAAPLAALGYSLRGTRYVSLWLYSCSMTSLCLAAGVLVPGKSEFIQRILIRGFDSTWLLAVLIGTGLVIRKFAEHPILFFLPKLKFMKSAGATIFLSVAILPLMGSHRMAYELARAGNFHLPKGEWEAIEYIRNVTNQKAAFLALDLTANQLIPVYTHADLYAATPVYSGNNPEEELMKFINGWKFLDLDIVLLENWFRGFPAELKAFKCRPGAKESWFDFEPSQTLKNILYYPFVKNIYGVPVVEAGGNHLSAEFKSKLGELLSKPIHRNEIMTSVEYITLSTAFELRRSKAYEAPQGYKLIFQNSDRTIYKRCQTNVPSVCT
ncbi:hypothetical protein [Oligoflexus tunisiensis]|uniref:hypothetical protein n=1 Tax=Oligoflexus tunisiensis TaxID=708132 RepID=UPI00114CB523|nr:hypothetical protein [Oligoflexus tunisiensis]